MIRESESGPFWLLPPAANLEILKHVHFSNVVRSSSEQPLESTAEVARAGHVQEEVRAETEVIKELEEALPRVDGERQLFVGEGDEEGVDAEGVAGQVEQQVDGGDDEQRARHAHLGHVAPRVGAPLPRLDGSTRRARLGRLPVRPARRALPQSVGMLVQFYVHSPLSGMTRSVAPNRTRVVVIRHTGIHVVSQRPARVVVNTDSDSSIHRHYSHGRDNKRYERVHSRHDPHYVVVLRGLHADRKVIIILDLLGEDGEHVEPEAGDGERRHDARRAPPRAQPVPLDRVKHDDVPAM